MLGHPAHNGLPDGFFIGEVPKQCALGQLHVLRDGGGGDLAGVLFGRQLNDRLDGYCTAFLRGQMLGMFPGRHRSKIVSNCSLSYAACM